MIIIKGINKSYGELKVLNDIDLQINSGEVITITGASGAGKSTLLHIIGTLDKPTSGTVFFDEISVFEMNDSKLSRFRNQKIGFVFQFHHLLPEFTALENVCIPAFIGGMSKKEAEHNAKELLDGLGLSNRTNHKPSELSGGEQQRVAVARSLINKPSVILADEPPGNLDSTNAKELHKLFFTLREKYLQTFIIVTHNPELAKMSDRIVHLKDGRVEN